MLHMELDSLEHSVFHQLSGICSAFVPPNSCHAFLIAGMLKPGLVAFLAARSALIECTQFALCKGELIPRADTGADTKSYLVFPPSRTSLSKLCMCSSAVPSYQNNPGPRQGDLG